GKLRQDARSLVLLFELAGLLDELLTEQPTQVFAFAQDRQLAAATNDLRNIVANQLSHVLHRAPPDQKERVLSDYKLIWRKFKIRPRLRPHHRHLLPRRHRLQLHHLYPKMQMKMRNSR